MVIPPSNSRLERAQTRKQPAYRLQPVGERPKVNENKKRLQGEYRVFMYFDV
jgi:hypothetical protein